MKILSSLALALAVSSVAACGGGGAEGPSGPLGSRPSYKRMLEEAAYINQGLSNMDDTLPALMPTSGTATYTGIAAIGPSFDEDLSALAVADMTANFATATMSGTFTNFRDTDNVRIPGRINLRNGRIVSNGYMADLRGNLIVDGTDERVSGKIVGGFGGVHAYGVVGIMEGRIGQAPYSGVVVADQ